MNIVPMAARTCPDSKLCLNGACLEVRDKLVKSAFLPSLYTARTPKKCIKFPAWPGLVHWTN